MDKDKAFKWADALDSGEHLQGFGVLETSEGKNCCLGVACKIFGIPREDWVGAALPSERQTIHFTMKSGSYGMFTSFRDRDGAYVTLTQLNDTGFTFPQIADLIRHFYEEL